MYAAITLFAVLTLSVLVIRTAAVALRVTGLPDHVARFQARSAYTGTGFTTLEAESVAHHPARRRIVGFLMILGNLGLVSVMATVIVGLVDSTQSERALMGQLAWLACFLLMLWAVALNPLADRIMCRVIGALIDHLPALQPRGAELLVQGPGGHGLYRLTATETAPHLSTDLPREVLVLSLRRGDGRILHRPTPDEVLGPQDALYVYGPSSVLAQLCDSHQPTAKENGE